MSDKFLTTSNLPVIDITLDNINKEWQNMISHVKTSTFVALDLEMSGLGNRKNLNQQSIEDRYKSVSQLANTYGILSIGISFFKVHKQTDEQLAILVENQTYNIFTYSEEFQVEARSLKFLIDHGLDLNKVFLKGLKHYKGNDKAIENEDTKCTVRSLINEISRVKLPVVFHNGFIDLIFLYQNFYAQLPETSIKFLADLEEIFSEGVYDTKFIAEYHLHLNISFLEYLYKKAMYENTQKKSSLRSRIHFEVLFPADEKITKLADYNIDLKKDLLVDKKICSNYSIHGYCVNIETCNKSHDINAIIQAELNKKKTKKSNQLELSIDEETNQSETIIQNNNDIKKCHNSGLDSFMTGLIFLNFINKTTEFKSSQEIDSIVKLNCFDLDQIKNKVYLTGKDYPLMIRKSNFVKTSINHKEKLNKQQN